MEGEHGTCAKTMSDRGMMEGKIVRRTYRVMSGCEDIIVADSDSSKQLGELHLSRGKRSILVCSKGGLPMGGPS